MRGGVGGCIKGGKGCIVVVVIVVVVVGIRSGVDAARIVGSNAIGSAIVGSGVGGRLWDLNVRGEVGGRVAGREDVVVVVVVVVNIEGRKVGKIDAAAAVSCNIVFREVIGPAIGELVVTLLELVTRMAKRRDHPVQKIYADANITRGREGAFCSLRLS